MFDSKFVITLLGLIVAVFAISNMNAAKVASITEAFGMNPSRVWKVDRITASSPEAAKKGDFYSVPGTYQAILNPRFSNVDYGANIRYNMPSYENQASPCNPLTFGNMVKENYGCGSSAPNSFNPSVKATEPGFAAGNYNDVLDSVYSNASYPEASSTLPVGDMTTINADGESVQPIIYDRYIYANRNSRLRSQGDPIRGDLPIVPSGGDWFRPSVHPSIDLQQGALSVIGGNQNETSNALSELIYSASGNAATIIGGVDMSTQFAARAGGGMNDVTITAFP